MGPAQAALSPGASSYSLHQPEDQRSAPLPPRRRRKQATALFLRLVKYCAASEVITEQLKAEGPMEWVSQVNRIRARVREVVNKETIAADS